jgi:hypothetical protein
VNVVRHVKTEITIMKTFLIDIFPKLQRYSQKLDNLTLLTNQHWVSIDNIAANKIVYIFRANNELLVSTNGKVEKAKWEYIGNKSLLIDKSDESYLFKHGKGVELFQLAQAHKIEGIVAKHKNSTYSGGVRVSSGLK